MHDDRLRDRVAHLFFFALRLALTTKTFSKNEGESARFSRLSCTARVSYTPVGKLQGIFLLVAMVGECRLAGVFSARAAHRIGPGVSS